MKQLLAPLALILTLTLPGLPAFACGPDTDCRIGDRSYRIYLPRGQDGTTPMGALIFAHGYKGSAAGTMRNGALRGMADLLGIALVAANAKGDDWRLPGTPSGGVTSPETELGYFDALRDDILANTAIDPDRIVMAGFSAGGMMTWTLACHRPADYAGFIPVAGTFWAPTPDSCTTPPADIIHVHGTSDRIVPLAGRAIGEARQGDVETVPRHVPPGRRARDVEDPRLARRPDLRRVDRPQRHASDQMPASRRPQLSHRVDRRRVEPDLLRLTRRTLPRPRRR